MLYAYLSSYMPASDLIITAVTFLLCCTVALLRCSLLPPGDSSPGPPSCRTTKPSRACRRSHAPACSFLARQQGRCTRSALPCAGLILLGRSYGAECTPQG